MGQARARGTRDQRVQQAIAARMETANRRVEFQQKLTERVELVQRMMRGEKVDLPQSLIDRLKPLGVTAVGAGDAVSLALPELDTRFSPEAAADAWLAAHSGEADAVVTTTDGDKVTIEPVRIYVDPAAPGADQTAEALYDRGVMLVDPIAGPHVAAALAKVDASGPEPAADDADLDRRLQALIGGQP